MRYELGPIVNCGKKFGWLERDGPIPGKPSRVVAEVRLDEGPFSPNDAGAGAGAGSSKLQTPSSREISTSKLQASSSREIASIKPQASSPREASSFKYQNGRGASGC